MEPLLTVTVKTVNGKHAEVAARGEIDASTQEQLRDQLVALVDGGTTDIVIDLGGVSFLDSSGLRGLIEAIKRGGLLRLTHLQPAVKLVFDIVEIPGLVVE